MLYNGVEQAVLFYGGIALIGLICSIGLVVWLVSHFFEEEEGDE